MSRALAYEASASVHKSIFLVSTFRDAWLGRADLVLSGYFTKIGDRIEYHASLENGSTRKLEQSMQASAGLQGVVPASESIARAMDRRMRPLGTQSGAAIEAWGKSMVADTPAARIESLRKAIAADRGFGAAYVDLVQTLLQVNDRPAADALLADAKQRLASFGDVDRARLELMDATLKDRPDERRTALVALSRLISTDPATMLALAQIELQGRRFAAAVDLYKSALVLEPSRSEVLNELGYAEAYRGNLEGARAAFDRYRDALPNQPNPRDSMGEAYFFLGKFDEAEKSFLEVEKIAPGARGGIELLKVAQARMMRGDLPGADQYFQKYLDVRRKSGDPLVAVEQAQWWRLSGRAKQAEDALAQIASEEGVGAYANVQLSLWRSASGDRQGAIEAAAHASRTANPMVRNMAAFAGFVATSRSGLEDWTRAAEAAFPGPQTAPLRKRAIAIGLVFSKDFAAATPLLREMYLASTPAFDAEVRTLYGWALVESGRAGDAAPLVENFPIPWHEANDAISASLIFPRFLAVRAAVRQAQGKADEAKALLDLFRKYGG